VNAQCSVHTFARMHKFQNPEDTICALATPDAPGALAIIRISGKDAMNFADAVFSGKLKKAKTHTAIFGQVRDGAEVIDEVLATVFRAPNSFTGENTVEISCHGSVYVRNRIIELLVSKGARLAAPGEFTLRSYLNGKMDLSQAEAVADLIAASSQAAHRMAIHQIRGGFGKELAALRQKLLDLLSLLELELDFGEEDVEFADKKRLRKLLGEMKLRVTRLADSFSRGNVLRNGVPVAIVGPPNAGKSTLLNALLNDEKAIVSDIPGTTRDVIDDTTVIEGVEFRFIDTAGIRTTRNKIEKVGVKRTFEQIRKARIILLLLDPLNETERAVIERLEKFKATSVGEGQTLIVLFNKSDRLDKDELKELSGMGTFISAKKDKNLAVLKKKLLKAVAPIESEEGTVVNNVRHFDVLTRCARSLSLAEDGLESGLSGELLAAEIRTSLELLGQITGEVTSDEVLGNIFSRFCIGK